ncbi:MAG: hypothetical protein EBR82_55675 [Caulobacteraceae bacterium]|nr:hypothetical protein [Caulobacteraceae bacterium]
MAHYAILNENNVVIQVIVGKNEDETWNDQPMDWEAYYGGKRTSYNTKGGVHYQGDNFTPSADQSKAFRKNYAGIGYTYDPVRDAFIPPKPTDDAVLDEATCQWIVTAADSIAGADSVPA